MSSWCNSPILIQPIVFICSLSCARLITFSIPFLLVVSPSNISSHNWSNVSLHSNSYVIVPTLICCQLLLLWPADGQSNPATYPAWPFHSGRTWSLARVVFNSLNMGIHSDQVILHMYANDMKETFPLYYLLRTDHPSPVLNFSNCPGT